MAQREMRSRLLSLLVLSSRGWSAEYFRLKQSAEDHCQSEKNCERSKNQFSEPVPIVQISPLQDRSKTPSEDSQTCQGSNNPD